MKQSTPPIVRLDGVTKRYGATCALDNVDFSCLPGEIHAVLGENGAGKSTLMKIISGVIQPSEGTLYVDGLKTSLSSPRAAVAAGLVCMFQELSLVPDLTVQENLMLGAPGSGLGRLPKKAVAQAQSVLSKIDGSHISLRARVADLSLAEQQQIEIAKALARNPRLLILDEATSALNASVVDKVFDLIRSERDRGVSILFISHRFHEIEALADRISVFRNGSHVETFDNGAYDYPEIISKMVGQRIDDLFPPKPPVNPDAEPVLILKGFGWEDEVHDVNITLRKGSILGLGGLDGQGQNRILQGLFGLLKKSSGKVVLEGREISLSSPHQAKQPDVGIALLPEDRKTEALVVQQSIRANMQLAALSTKGVKASDLALYQPYLDALELKYATLEQPVGQLSGGNQQKVALTKWLALKPRCLLLADPTRGIDVKTKTQIYRLLRQLADAGTAIVLLSTDYEEFIHLCDETHIFYDGRVVRHLKGHDVTANNILSAALNIPTTEVSHA